MERRDFIKTSIALLAVPLSVTAGETSNGLYRCGPYVIARRDVWCHGVLYKDWYCDGRLMPEDEAEVEDGEIASSSIMISHVVDSAWHPILHDHRVVSLDVWVIEYADSIVVEEVTGVRLRYGVYRMLQREWVI